ncbi:DUF5946 family protein [Candidatus Palauibacter sp.]|uniref:DUF5946 family protein n=1 Tax=Candidatus Palauibacter sp. TaxID=3101350 RepID=UPI003AF20D9C
MTPAAEIEPCRGCGALVPRVEGATHRYLDASPGCWETLGRVLAKEFSRRAYFQVHALTVDAYAVQHPGTPSPQTIQSVAVHLIALYAMLELGWPADRSSEVRKEAKRGLADAFAWLDPPQNLGAVTVVDVAAAASAADHQERVRKWARSAWDAWAAHHETVRGWASRTGIGG